MHSKQRRRSGWSRSTGKRTRHGLVRLLTASVVACALATGAPSWSADSAASDSTVVEISAAQADSLVNLIDDLDLEVALLRVDLNAASRRAEMDSTMAARRLMLQRHHYEQVIDIYKKDREHFIIRALKHPAIWFMVGAYAGLQAAR